MRKSAAILTTLVCLIYMVSCGGSSTVTFLSTTSYDLPAPLAAPYPTVLGGAIQGKPLVLSNTVTRFAGSSAGFLDSTTATGAMFNRPIALTTDGTNLYVADYYNNAIRKVVIATGAVTTIAGSTAGLAGSADGVGVAASFNRPTDITTDGTSLYVTDSVNFTIRRITLSTGSVTTLAGGVGLAGAVDNAVGLNARFGTLNGITTDGTNLYVTDANSTVRRIVIATGAVSTLAGSPGSVGSADGIQSAARFNQPAHITTDGANLYVADFYGRTIRKIVLATGAVTTIAGATGPLGTDEGTTDGVGTVARFNQPNGITSDGTNLYVTDSYKNTIRRIVIATGAVTTISGIAGTVGNIDTANGTPVYNTPIGITTNGTALFVADSQNSIICRIQ